MRSRDPVGVHAADQDSMVSIDPPSSVSVCSSHAVAPTRRSSSLSSSSASARGRAALLIAIVVCIPLLSHWEDFGFAATSRPHQKREQSGDLASEAFNSYKLNAPLFEAIKQNDLKLVQSLLQGGVDAANQKGSKTSYYNVNAEDAKGLTPLIEATLLGNKDLVELLLTNGAKAQPAPGFRHTALRAACLTANPQLITLLLKRGADPNAMSEGGRTPLMGACYLRPQFDAMENRTDLSVGAVRTMLQDPRTDPKIKNDFGESALDLCRQRGYTKSIVLLRQRMGGGRLGGKIQPEPANEMQ
ncbi:hypothetical protein ACHAXT_008321 [Thalassiosira profunda]